MKNIRKFALMILLNALLVTHLPQSGNGITQVGDILKTRHDTAKNDINKGP